MSDFIDGVNWVEREIPTAKGPVKMVGLTARSLRLALEKCDGDDLICYMAEMTPEIRDVDLLLGAIAGTVQTKCGVTMLVGPEAVRALKREGHI